MAVLDRNRWPLCVGISGRFHRNAQLEDSEMGFLLLLAVVGIGVIAWLLFKIDAKLQAIGDMINDAAKAEEPRRINK